VLQKKSLLDGVRNQYGLEETQIQLIEQHWREVLAANKDFNLTAINDYELGICLHIEDSLSALPELLAAVAGPLVDMGSGAGYPGIPLAIASGRETVLVESVGKKAGFVQGVVDRLGLSGSLEVFNGRVEDFSRENLGSCAVAVARAVAKLSVLLEYAQPLLFVGGRLIAYKGQLSAEEDELAERVAGKLGFEKVSERRLTLSDGASQRTIVVYEKTGESSVLLPRKAGMAVKRPLL